MSEITNIRKKLCIGLNTMLIGSRDLEEAYSIADHLESALPICMDLRSRRSSVTDRANLWDIAHSNSDFNISCPDSIDKALHLSDKYGRPIIAVSLYCSALNRQDKAYGFEAIRNAHYLSRAGLDNCILLRFLGGNAITSSDKMRAVQAIASWADYAHRLNGSAEGHVNIGLEIHQGQWPDSVEDAIEVRNMLTLVSGTDNLPVGFIEDPTNRYIADPHTYLAQDPSVFHLIDGLIYCHIKNVARLGDGPANEISFQKVGDKSFIFGGSRFEWSDSPAAGDVGLTSIISYLSANCPNLIGFSTEHVPATKDMAQALMIGQDYVSFICDSLDLYSDIGGGLSLDLQK